MAAGDTALSLAINVTAADLASATFQNVWHAMQSGQGVMGAVQATAALAGGALLGMGTQAVTMAGNFQEGMTSLVTGAGEAAGNLQMVSDGIKQISLDTGDSTQQLISGMYEIESSGLHGAAGLQALQVAAQGAKVGSADLGVTANALTTILTDYHLSANNAAGAMNALITTVASGKTHLQDLATAMGSVLPLASSLGISFPQVAGAIATMTNAGMDARRASMNLANAIRSLAAPTSAAQTAMVNVGLSAQELKNTLSQQGLAGAIQLVEEHVSRKFPAGSVQAVEAFKAIMGGATGYNVALMLGGKNMATYESDVNAIAASMKGGAQGVTGWADVQRDLNTQIDRAKAAFDVLLITLGTKLLPLLTPLIAHVAQGITGFMQWEAQTHGLENALHTIGTVIGTVVSIGASIITFFQHNQVAAAALILVIGALGGVLALFAASAAANAILSMMEFGLSILTTTAEAVTGAVTMTTTFGTMAGMISASMATAAASIAATLGPFLLIGALVAAAIVGIILAIQHWGQIVTWLRGVWQGFASWFQGIWQAALKIPGVQGIVNFFVGLWNGIKNAAQAAWSGITSGIGNALNGIKNGAQTAASSIGSWFSNAWGTISTGFQQHVAPALATGWNNVKSGAQNAASAVASWFSRTWSTISTGFQQHVAPALATAWSNVKSGAQSAGAFLLAQLKNAWSGIQQAWKASPLSGFFTSVLQSFQNLGGVVQKTLAQGFAPVMHIFDSLAATLRQQLAPAFAGLAPAFAGLQRSFTDAWKSIQGVLASVGQAIGGAFLSAWKALQPALVSVGQAIGGAFQAAWKAIQQAASVIGPILGQIASTVGGALLSAWKAIQPALSAVGNVLMNVLKPVLPILLTVFEAIGAVIGGVVLLAIAALLGAIVGVANAIANIVSGIIKVFTGIITFISGFIQVLVGIVTFIVDLVTGHFNKLGGDLGTIWKGIQTMFSGVLMIIQGLFQSTIGAIIGLVSGFISTIINFFKNLFNSLVGHSIIPDLVKGIFSWFGQLPAFFVNLMSNIGNFLKGAWGTLSTNVVNWAKNMLSMFGNTIQKGAQTVLGPIQNIAGGIAKVLGFHSPPPSGPLATSGQWMNNMMAMFGNNIQTSAHLVLGQINTLMLGMSKAVQAGITSLLTQFQNFTTKVEAQIKQLAITVQQSVLLMVQALTMLAVQWTQLLNQILLQLTKFAEKVKTTLTDLTHQFDAFKLSFHNLEISIQTGVTNIAAQFQTLDTKLHLHVTNIDQDLTILEKTIQDWKTQFIDAMQQVSQEVLADASIIIGQFDLMNQAMNTFVSTVIWMDATVVPILIDVGNSFLNLTSVIVDGFESLADSALFNFADTLMWAGDITSQMTSKMSSAFMAMGMMVQSSVQGMSRTVIDSFTSMQSFFKTFVDFVTAAFAQAAQSVSQFGQMIASAAQAAVAASTAMAASMAAVLGHSTPKTGPLANDNVWGQHFVENLTTGIQAGMPGLAKTTNALASMIAGTISPTLSGGIPAGGLINGGGTNQPMVINLNLDSKTIGKVVTTYQQRELRVQGIVRGI